METSRDGEGFGGGRIMAALCACFIAQHYHVFKKLHKKFIACSLVNSGVKIYMPLN